MQGRAIVNDEMLSFESTARSGAGPLPEGQNLEAFGRAIDADLLLHVPRALLDPWMERRGQKGAQLRMLVERGVLRSTPNAYETRLQYEGGKLRINGVPADALNSRRPPSS